MLPKLPRLSLVVTFIIALSLDQSSKWMTQRYLPLIDFQKPFYPYGGVGIFKQLWGISFSLNYAVNEGAAWGLFADYSSPLLAVRLLSILFLALYLFYKTLPYGQALALCAILAGAVGNTSDFFSYGHVIDLFHFSFGSYHFPIFNVADACICLGVLALLAWELRHSAASPGCNSP